LIDPMEDNIEIDGSAVPDLFAPVTHQYLVDRSRQTWINRHLNRTGWT